MARTLEQARQASTPAASSWDWLHGLTGDRRARQVNDLVTIHVVESVSASGTADSSLNKSSHGTTGIGGLFGLEKAIGSVVDPASLVGAKHESDFKGGGATTRA